MPIPTLAEFLAQAKETIIDARTNLQQVTLVMGKNQPDLDSITSAIVFAYFRSALPPDDCWAPIYIPILNESRAELGDQTYLNRVLPHSSIGLPDLVAVEDIVLPGSTQSGLKEELVRLFFVDHNKTLGREKQDYSHRVIGCIDHTPDENYVPQDTTPEPRMIIPAGSCTSLVVNFSREAWESVEFKTPDEESRIAKMALAAILVDTKNLISINATEEDISAVAFLMHRIRPSTNGRVFDRTDYYYEIIGKERPRPKFAPAPVVKAAPIEPEPEPVIVPEPIVEEHIPEPEPEPAIIEPVFVDESPVVLAQPEPVEEPVVEEEPRAVTPEPVAEPEQPVTPESKPAVQPMTPRSPFPRVYLADVLDHDFETGYEGGGAIGISFTPMSLATLVVHAERDLVERAMEEAHEGMHPVEESPSKVMKGTPFTAAVRDFAMEKGLSVYAIRTNTKKGNELFIWVLNNSMAYYIPRFVQSRASQLKLEKWGADDHVISREAGMNEGMMGAYWIRNDPGRDAVRLAIIQGTSYIFFGAPAPPPPRRSKTKTSPDSGYQSSEVKV